MSFMRLPVGFLLLIFVVMGTSLQMVHAQEDQSQSSGIIPLHDYTGDFSQRAYLLGDLNGKRTEWSKKGVTFDIDFNQVLQSVIDGGIERDTKYGGTLDYNVNLDFDRMGLIPGGLLSVRAVSRYGKSVNAISGSLVPVNTDATHPMTAQLDEDVALMLPVINYTQFLSSKFAVALGKFDTYDSSNEFSGGRGRSQYWNMNLTMPFSAALFVPYSTAGGLFLYMPIPTMTITGMIGTSTDTSNNSGFNHFDDGMFGLVSLTQGYAIKGLPGGFGLTGGYAWDNEFLESDGHFSLTGAELKPATKDTSWFLSADFWQYLWVKNPSKTLVDPANGRQDLQGVGVFSRIQYADDATNLAEYIISAGVNAKGLIPGRDADCLGLGFSYNSVNTGRLLNASGVDDKSAVLEFFYNIELTPAVHMTLDAQFADSSLPGAETARLLGASMQIVF